MVYDVTHTCLPCSCPDGMHTVACQAVANIAIAPVAPRSCWHACYSSVSLPICCRWVHNADPVSMLPSSCQISGASQYKHVGTLMRVRSTSCPTRPTKTAQIAQGQCNPPFHSIGYATAPTQCSMQLSPNAFDDCSVWVRYNALSDSYTNCYCGVMPGNLVNALLADHNAALYATGLDGCVSLAAYESGEPAAPLKCSTASPTCAN